jgi:hypothetical protein
MKAEIKTRLLGSIEVRFFPLPNQRLEGKVMHEQLKYNNAASTNGYIHYVIGF